MGRLPDDDEMHLEDLTHRLRNELNELDVEKVEVEVVKSGKAPDESKAGFDVPAWGSLLIIVVSGVIPAIVRAVQSWLKREEGRSVTMEIGGDKLEVTGVSSEQQSALINDWLDRHSTKTKTDA